jgi:hypothetical protein
VTQQYCYIERATILSSMLFPTRFTFQIRGGFVWPQTRQSLAIPITWDLEPIICYNATTWAIPSQRIKFRPELGVTERLWPWLWKWGLENHYILVCVAMATSTVRLVHTCHLIYVGMVVVGHHINLWCNRTTVLICLTTHRLCLDVVPDYQTIRE